MIKSRSIAFIVSAGLVALIPACEKPAPDQDPLKKDTTKPAADTAKSAGESAVADIKKATSTESAKEVPATVKDAIADAKAVLSSTFSVDELKKAAPAFDTAKLQEIADKIVTAIKEKATDLAAVKELKAKLQVVVDQLKAKGIDVSKYTAYLA